MTPYHHFDSLRELHIEITNKCNAACPMCARNNHGGSTRSELQLTEWDKEDIPRVFSPQFKHLENIMFCGTHGDPAAARYALEAVEYLKTHFSTRVEFYSNSSLRSATWWKELGILLKDMNDRNNKPSLGIFSVDGLQDTNHLYRRKTDFNKIMENAQSFIQAGGQARWDFIVFKHNEHQVEEAQKLAKKMGFKQFRIRKTSRFFYSPDGPEKYKVLNNDGQLEYYLEPPQNDAYKNQQIPKYFELSKNGIEHYFNTTTIKCLNKTTFQRIYINAELKVFPCCFIGNDSYSLPKGTSIDSHQKVFMKYGLTFNSLKHHNWKDILTHDWFHSELVKSWEQNLEQGRLVRCARTCGSEFSPILSQSQNRSL